MWSTPTQPAGVLSNDRAALTDRPENITVSDGTLKLTIKVESPPYDDGTDGGAEYTTGKATMYDNLYFKYGYFVARIKLPTGVGFWPAFWLTGQSLADRYWPTPGEIDIVESVNFMEFYAGAVHAGEGNIPPQEGDHWSISRRTNLDLGTDWHLYAVDWSPGRIEYFLDNISMGVTTQADTPAGKDWPFDTYPETIILSFGAGGTWPEDDAGGPPDPSTWSGDTMEVDYVRVYNTTTSPPE